MKHALVALNLTSFCLSKTALIVVGKLMSKVEKTLEVDWSLKERVQQVVSLT